MIMGPSDDGVDYIVFPYGTDLNQYEQKIEAYVKKSKDEGVVILADLFGGSPFMISSKVYNVNKDICDIEIITGMNLLMVIEAISSHEFMNAQELKNHLLKSGSEGIVSLSDKLRK